MLPGTAGANVRKTARYGGKDCDPLQFTVRFHHFRGFQATLLPSSFFGRETEETFFNFANIFFFFSSPSITYRPHPRIPHHPRAKS